MDLRVTGICKKGTPFVTAPGCGYIGSLGIRRQIECVSIPPGAQQNAVSGIFFEFAGNQVADDNPPRDTINLDQVQHFPSGKELNTTGAHLSHQGTVGSQQQLLPGLSAGIKCARHLGTTERTVCQGSAIIAGKRNSLCCTLVDNVITDLCQTMHVGFAAAEVSPFDSIVKQSPYTVTIIGIVLGSVDSALGSNTVCSTWRILKTEGLNLIAQFCQGRRSRCTCQPGTDYDDFFLALVRRVNQLHFLLATIPFLGHRPFRNARI